MTNKIIIADAGPLIAFGRLKQLSLLAETLGQIIAPLVVFTECVSDHRKPGAKEILEAKRNQLITVQAVSEDQSCKELFDFLGPGEASAISLAAHLKEGLLIDEKLGRDVAKKMKLRVIGTAGVLVLAKKKKLIKKVMPLIHDLRNNGYYLSDDLTKQVLHLANEA